jgi:hypothetical protein
MTTWKVIIGYLGSDYEEEAGVSIVALAIKQVITKDVASKRRFL